MVAIDYFECSSTKVDFDPDCQHHSRPQCTLVKSEFNQCRGRAKSNVRCQRAKSNSMCDKEGQISNSIRSEQADVDESSIHCSRMYILFTLMSHFAIFVTLISNFAILLLHAYIKVDFLSLKYFHFRKFPN